MAARRMKGVVRPQAMPTRRKPSIQRNTEGEGASVVGVSVDEAIVGGLWRISSSRSPGIVRLRS